MKRQVTNVCFHFCLHQWNVTTPTGWILASSICEGNGEKKRRDFAQQKQRHYFCGKKIQSILTLSNYLHNASQLWQSTQISPVLCLCVCADTSASICIVLLFGKAILRSSLDELIRAKKYIGKKMSNVFAPASIGWCVIRREFFFLRSWFLLFLSWLYFILLCAKRPTNNQYIHCTIWSSSVQNTRELLVSAHFHKRLIYCFRLEEIRWK